MVHGRTLVGLSHNSGVICVRDKNDQLSIAELQACALSTLFKYALI